MIRLPQVTLIALGSEKYKEAHQRALDLSSKEVEFGAVKNITNDALVDLDSYSYAILFELWKHVDTSHALIVQGDSWIIHPELWRDEWLNFDYIGSPWPLPNDYFSYRDGKGQIIRVGNGGFSLRSIKLLKSLIDLNLPFTDKGTGYFNEDGVICCYYRNELEEYGIKFAPLGVAKYFSKEHEIEENKGIKTFGFHKYN